MIELSFWDLALGASLVLGLGLASWWLQVGLAGKLVVGALRTLVQLLLLGYAIHFIFAQESPAWVLLISLIMLLAAGREVSARQKRGFKALSGFWIGTGAMMTSSFLVALFTLVLIIQQDPWYHPQYAIPFLGILLGNTMNGISLGLDRLTQGAYEQKEIIEARLLLGMDWAAAIAPLKREAFRNGLTPIVNTMAAAGLVSLPGMMTGQILAGGPPIEAAKYQILIIFLIVAGTGFGILVALQWASRRLFDSRQRLDLSRLRIAG